MLDIFPCQYINIYLFISFYQRPNIPPYEQTKICPSIDGCLDCWTTGRNSIGANRGVIYDTPADQSESFIRGDSKAMTGGELSESTCCSRSPDSYHPKRQEAVQPEGHWGAVATAPCGSQQWDQMQTSHSTTCLGFLYLVQSLLSQRLFWELGTHILQQNFLRISVLLSWTLCPSWAIRPAPASFLNGGWTSLGSLLDYIRAATHFSCSLFCTMISISLVPLCPLA